MNPSAFSHTGYYRPESILPQGTKNGRPYWESLVPDSVQRPPVSSVASPAPATPSSPLPAMLGAMRLGSSDSISTMPWSPENQQWLYLDPNGNVQGPFPATSMQSWYEQQYLYMDLLVRRKEDPQFRPLYSVVQETSDSVTPFLVPPPLVRSTPHTPTLPTGRISVPLSTAATPEPEAPASQPKPASQPVATAPPDATPSNLSPEDLATTLRVMKQLETMLQGNGTSEAQITQLLQKAIVAAMPHANAAGIDEMQNAMREQRENGGSTQETASTPAPDSAQDTQPPQDTKPAKEAPKTAKARRAAKEEAAKAEAKGQPKGEPKGEPKDVAKEAPAEQAAAPVRAKPEAKSAPWASPAPQSTQRSQTAPSLREILEGEERERASRVAQEKAVAAARIAQETTAAPASPTPRAASGAAWSIPNKTPAAKSLSQIQQEESVMAQHAKAAQPPRPTGYSSSAVRGVETVRHNEPWTKVGPQGKAMPVPPKPQPQQQPQPKVQSHKPAPAPVVAPAPPPVSAPASDGWEEVGDGWVTKKTKGQVRRDALSQMNDSIPRPTGAPAGLTAPRRMAPSATPLPPSTEFLRYCRSQLGDLRANVDDFIDMLLSFPLTPSPETEEIIAEAVYANSSTLNGRRFAADFLARRKQDAFRAVAL